MEKLLLVRRDRCLFRVMLAPMFFLVFFCFFLSAKFPQAGTRGEGNFQSKLGAIIVVVVVVIVGFTLGCENQMRELLY